MTDYRDLNRANWNDRAAAHAAAPDYAAARFAEDPGYLSGTVRFDRGLLGSLTGQRGLHLQCHIGTDTISLSRLGAAMTGLDLSDKSVEEARRIAAAAGADIRFVQSDVYDALAAVGDGYDLVYTGIGALCWLPDVARWARVVASLLRPGGRLFLREGHPMLWALDDDMSLALPYFETAEPIVWDSAESYLPTETPLTHTVTHQWNHGLGEIVTGVLDAGLTLTALIEHRSVPWEALPGRMRRVPGGEWQLADRPERLPLTYTLQAVRAV